LPSKSKSRELHFTSNIGWLRAAVLGANDGIISVASLIMGVAATSSNQTTIVLTGVAALAAGALSMAAGEYVSVSSQADTEKAELAREKGELDAFPDAEREELATIYIARGLPKDLADRVAEQLMKRNPLEAHARDELGLYDMNRARPVQAAITSALTFSSGAVFPILTLIVSPRTVCVWTVGLCALGLLGVLGAVGALMGGANIVQAIARVIFWGGLAMAATAAIGHFAGAML